MRATSYTAELSDGAQAHWDNFVFEYDPLGGWSSQYVGGNAHGSTQSWFKLLADDGTSGQQVQVDVTFRVDIISEITDPSVYITPDAGPAASASTKIANFAGIDGFISGQAMVGDYTTTKIFPVSSPVIESSAFYISYTMTGITGETNFVYNDVWPSHMDETPEHFTLSVHDSAAPAATGLLRYLTIDLTDARVVPDTANTLTLLLISFVGLWAIAQNRRGKAASTKAFSGRGIAR